MRTVMVPVGEFRVSTDPTEVLTTCVGSCVAVVLSDPAARVGGLLHAVLPEPLPGGGGADFPRGYYADPGLRLLIEEVLRRGGGRDSLTAVVAGGASLLPRMDGGLAVGKRNQRKVLSLLGEAAIPVRTRELGGTEGRRVTLVVGTGEVEVRGTLQTGLSETSAPPGPGAPQVRAVANALAQLGPNPRTAGALLDALHRTEIDWSHVGDLVSRDIVLTLQVLRLANSEACGRSREVDSLASGVALLGAAQVRRICVLVAMARNAIRSLTDLGPLEPGLSRHGLATALAARRLAEGVPERERREVFSASLLHGVDAVAARLLEPEGASHAVSGLGAAVLSEWNLPGRLIDTLGGDRVRQACGVAHWLGLPCESHPDGSLSNVPSESTIRAIIGDLCAADLLDGFTLCSQGGTTS